MKSGVDLENWAAVAVITNGPPASTEPTQSRLFLVDLLSSEPNAFVPEFTKKFFVITLVRKSREADLFLTVLMELARDHHYFTAKVAYDD